MNSSHRVHSQKGLFAGLTRAIARRWKRWTSSLIADHYRPEKHYMRGPGPKAKRSDDTGGNPSGRK